MRYGEPEVGETAGKIMASKPKSALGSVGRATTGPLRNYFNNHFEMTKEEVRRVVAISGAEAPAATQTGQHLAELSNVIAETQLYQSKLISELRREIASLRSEIDQMASTSAELAAVLSAMTLASDSD